MLRVAYLFERFPSFGQTFCYREVAELRRQGAEVTVFSIRRPTDEPAQDWDEEIVRRVAYLPDQAELVKEVNGAIRGGDLPQQATQMVKEWDRRSDFLRLYQAAYVGLRLQRADIQRVHAHFAGLAARTAYWIKRFFGIEFSVTAHANDIFAPRDFVVSLEKIFAEATAVVTVSDFAVAHLRQKFPQHAAKFHRVYNGIDPSRFQEARFDSAMPSIISVGRLIEKKGFSDLISACSLLKSAGTPFRCEIIGEGPLAEALASQIAEAQLEAEVKLLGTRTQVQIAERLAAATVFVLPCVEEADGGIDNLPTVIMEAMASGLPVISTPLAGIPEMVQPALTGLLVPPRNPGALAKAITEFHADPSTARALGACGRKAAAEKFSVAANVTTLANLLQQAK